MSAVFEPGNFKRVALDDRSFLERRLVEASPCNCELNFANMYIWGFTYLTKWQEFRGRIYVHLEGCDEFLFPAGELPAVSELSEVSAAMRKAGFSGAFWHVPENYIKANADELSGDFEFEQAFEDEGEYIYLTERLAVLPGSKLSKKRNLIAQFKRLHPDVRCVSLDDKWTLDECVKLSMKWREGKIGAGIEIAHEWEALCKAFESHDATGMEGLAAYSGRRLAAFSMFSRVSKEMYTVHFEKSDMSFKGAAQYINNETAKALLGKCEFINREQDLGMDGLRKAKRSYDPLRLQRNWSILPKQKAKSVIQTL